MRGDPSEVKVCMSDFIILSLGVPIAVRFALSGCFKLYIFLQSNELNSETGFVSEM
jgi:hypothetical protein